MKLRIFQSDKGDCLLLQSRDGINILCDGGMAESMRKYVREPLAQLVNKGSGILDVVYVSHIDQDHISGVLQLLQDALDWKIYSFHQNNGRTSVREPKFARPPSIGGLWHNAFRDQVEDNTGRIEDLLAASVPVFFGTSFPDLLNAAHEAQNIATSIPEAIKVSRLCKADLLNIPINVLSGRSRPAKLLYFRNQPVRFDLGSLKITIVGPSKMELDDLRKGWNNWLAEHPADIVKIQNEMRKRVEEFANGRRTATPFDLSDWNGIRDFKGVTAPNVASLVLMVEEDGKRLLLTGDSQQDKILEGLVKTGFLEDSENGFIHLDVLKIQHHGSEHNLDQNFARKVSADHYVFCGNGSNGNPEPGVLETVYNSRVGSTSRRTLAPQVQDRPFTFWFSTNSQALPSQSAKRESFEETERLVAGMIARSNGLMKAEFVEHDYRTLEI
jgi:beta-lactamase superfamily II metal-dependent hydrolase